MISPKHKSHHFVAITIKPSIALHYLQDESSILSMEVGEEGFIVLPYFLLKLCLSSVLFANSCIGPFEHHSPCDFHSSLHSFPLGLVIEYSHSSLSHPPLGLLSMKVKHMKFPVLTTVNFVCQFCQFCMVQLNTRTLSVLLPVGSQWLARSPIHSECF